MARYDTSPLYGRAKPLRLSDVPIRVVPQRIAHVRALVVDSKPDTRRILAKVLGNVGIRKVVEHDPAGHTPEKILASRPDVILLDWTSSPADSAALMARIRNPAFAMSEIPVLAIVQMLTQPIAKAIMRTGVNDMVTLPVSPASIFSRIDHALHVKRPFIQTETYYGPSPRSRMSGYSDFIRAIGAPVQPPAAGPQSGETTTLAA